MNTTMDTSIPISLADDGAHRVQTRLVSVRLFWASAQLIDAHPWMSFFTASFICAWARLASFPTHFLGHDELYTYYIAQAPTLRELLRLTQTVDLHPPLLYLLIRASFGIFGVSTWACRLPSVLAFLLATALIFWLIRRLLSPLYGIIAILLLWSAPFTYYVDQARPYSLQLFFTTLMLVCWYLAIEIGDSPPLQRRRSLALLLLSVAAFGLLLSHVLAVLTYACFFAAELIRLLIRRKWDWGLLAALLIPSTSCLVYLPLFRTHAHILFTNMYRPTPMRMVNFYLGFFRYLLIPLLSIAVLLFVWPMLRRKRSIERSGASTTSRAVFLPLAVLLSCFSLVPLAIGVLFARTGTAFFDRYGIVFFIPITVIPTLLLGLRTRMNQAAALTVTLILSAAFFLNTYGKMWFVEQLAEFANPSVAKYALQALALPPIIYEAVQPMVSLHLRAAFASAQPIADLDSIDPDLPVVANTGLTFLELDHEADNRLAARLYLLDDELSASTIAHDTVFEHYDRLAKVFPIRGSVVPYCDFIRTHDHFVAIGAYNHPQGWLLKKLDRDGADLHLIGTYRDITEDAQVYEVTTSSSAGCSNRQAR